LFRPVGGSLRTHKRRDHKGRGTHDQHRTDIKTEELNENEASPFVRPPEDCGNHRDERQCDCCQQPPSDPAHGTDRKCSGDIRKHGQLIRAGVTGRFGGYLEGTITGGTFKKNATCAAACFTGDFISAFFGAGAAFSCDGATNSTDCKFNYNYTAPSREGNRPKLIVRHWQDKGKGSGTTLDEHFKGDIASS
jgi:hypothetical protein